MANPNDGQTIASAWENVVGKKPEDNIFEEYWLLDRLKAGKAFKGFNGGRNITPLIEYALNTTVTSLSDTETISTTRIDVFDQAEFDFKEYGGTAVISEKERSDTQGSGGKFDLLAGKLANLRMSLMSKLSEGCFSDGTGNSSKDIGGLQHIVASTPTSGTVGGIDRSSFSFWRNQQESGAQTTSDFDNLRSGLRSQYNLCSNGYGGKHPEFIVTTRTVFEGYESLLTPGERFNDKSTGDGGFKNTALKFKGADIAYDNDCLSGAAYLLNSSFLKLGYVTGKWMKGFEAVAPTNQFISVFKVYTRANMFTTNPRQLGVLTSIS